MEQMAHSVDPFVSLLGIFVLAVFVGYYVVWNVTPALHTPLMSVTNAISGIVVVGALLQIGSGNGLVVFLSAVAVLIASINIVGGQADLTWDAVTDVDLSHYRLRFSSATTGVSWPWLRISSRISG